MFRSSSTIKVIKVHNIEGKQTCSKHFAVCVISQIPQLSKHWIAMNFMFLDFLCVLLLKLCFIVSGVVKRSSTSLHPNWVFCWTVWTRSCRGLFVCMYVCGLWKLACDWLLFVVFSIHWAAGVTRLLHLLSLCLCPSVLISYLGPAFFCAMSVSVRTVLYCTPGSWTPQ
jgi:hypothetical protein